MKWAYGVQAVADRVYTLLPKTLLSLDNAGFPSPRIFMDGEAFGGDSCIGGKSYEVTRRYPKIRTFGNWILGIAELLIREPTADLYAMFQDDCIAYRNLREYLESCTYPQDGYWNLFTFPYEHNRLKVDKSIGWHRSTQRGLGAVGLVFNRDIIFHLLGHQNTWRKVENLKVGHKNLDGRIVQTMTEQRKFEYVHYPSLIEHTGMESTIGNVPNRHAEGFKGEEFNAKELIKG